MQRKNDLLKPMKRSGIAMIMAVAVLVVLATIMAFSIQMTTKTGKRVVDIYIRNQAELYAKNAAEFALFQISRSASRCSPASIGPFTIDGLYKVTVDLDYAYADNNTSTCGVNDYVTLTNPPVGQSDREYGYVKIDVTVDVNSSSVNSEPIRIFRRYIEDITPYLQ